jgi:hypothetical protein
MTVVSLDSSSWSMASFRPPPRPCLVDKLGPRETRTAGQCIVVWLSSTMKNGVKPVDLLGIVRKLQSTKGTSAAHFPTRVLSQT